MTSVGKYGKMEILVTLRAVVLIFEVYCPYLVYVLLYFYSSKACENLLCGTVFS